jgi:putative FmdB family regulatory protein
MPIYEYRCQKCGETTEIMQKFSDRPLSHCPSCRGKVSRIISNCSFQLRGSGWYVTDYKKKVAGKDKETEPTKSETPKSDTTVSKSEEKKP